MADAFKLDDLITPLSREQIEANIYKVFAANGVSTTSWKTGAVVRTFITAVSLVLAGLSKLQANIARSGFLEMSVGTWLTNVARYVYGVEREGATFAGGPVKLTNTAGGVFAQDADDCVIRDPLTGKTYRNVEPFALGAAGSPTDEIIVQFEATEQGAASSCGPDAITEFVTPLNGVDVTNTAAFVGFDEESDPALRARCSEKLGALSPFGPWDAYAAAVRNARLTNGKKTLINRIRLDRDGFGNVTAYVASPAGAVAGTTGNLTTDLGAADEAVQRLAAPLCVTAFTESAVPHTVSFTYEVWMYSTSGRSPAEIEAAIETRLGEFFAGQPIGGNVLTGGTTGRIYEEAIRAAIISTFPGIIFRCEIVEYANEDALELEINEVAVFGTATVAAIHQVSQPEGLAAAA